MSATNLELNLGGKISRHDHLLLLPGTRPHDQELFKVEKKKEAGDKSNDDSDVFKRGQCCSYDDGSAGVRPSSFVTNLDWGLRSFASHVSSKGMVQRFGYFN